MLQDKERLEKLAKVNPNRAMDELQWIFNKSPMVSGKNPTMSKDAFFMYGAVKKISQLRNLYKGTKPACIPQVLADYDAKHGDQWVTFDDMSLMSSHVTADDVKNAIKQITVSDVEKEIHTVYEFQLDPIFYDTYAINHVFDKLDKANKKHHFLYKYEMQNAKDIVLAALEDMDLDHESPQQIIHNVPKVLQSRLFRNRINNNPQANLEDQGKHWKLSMHYDMLLFTGRPFPLHR